MPLIEAAAKRSDRTERVARVRRHYLARAVLFFFFFDACFFLGQPFCMSRYALREIVDFDFGRDLPALLRRLMFATSEFLCCFELRFLARLDFAFVAIAVPPLETTQRLGRVRSSEVAARARLK